MRNLVQILCLCLLFTPLLTGQFSDNFSDGDFTTNPTWEGDVLNFKINVIGELQLNDNEAGTSKLYIPVEIQSDFTWEIDFSLNFAPSDNNMAKIYFLIDNIDPSLANGYYVEIGENLAMDRLKFFRLDAGIPTILAEGEMGALAQKPANASLRLDRVEGLWTVSSDYEKQGQPLEELNFFDDLYEFQTEGFFMIETKYTSSNADEIFIDNIVGKTFVPDIEGPILLDFENIGANQLKIIFNESIEPSSLNNLILEIKPENDVEMVELSGNQFNELLVQFSDNFESGPVYTVNLSGLTDEKNNVMLDSDFEFVLPVSPSVGDLVINEILFDPRVNGTDYIEIMNRTDKILELQGIKLANRSKENDVESISESLILKGQEIIAFSNDTASTYSDYMPIVTANIYPMKIPSLNKADGNVSILLPDETLLDSYDYTEDQHLSLIDDTKGVSLERIFPNSNSIPENFTSGVQSTNYGTPGYTNANFRNETAVREDVVILESEVFSPNADGDKDQLIMFLKLPDVGYLSTIRIYNLNGQIIKVLQNNQLTAKEDIARWDGIMEDGGKAASGHYIVHFQAFKDSGETIEVKKHIKLLDFF